MTNQIHISRRRFGRLGAAALAGGSLTGVSALTALQAPIVSTKTGDVPTTGGMRPGPLGMAPTAVTRNRGVRPIALRIDKIGVDLQVEILQIVDGVMQNPTGPWVVGWYEQTGGLGQFTNVVEAAHVDYWNVGPAAFFRLRELVEGDEVVGVGEDNESYLYQVKFQETVEVSGLTTEKIGEIVGPTKVESLTLLTCGGEFDYSSGEYLSRTYVRCERVKN
jgi:hypothetical protein